MTLPIPLRAGADSLPTLKRGLRRKLVTGRSYQRWSCRTSGLFHVKPSPRTDRNAHARPHLPQCSGRCSPWAARFVEIGLGRLRGRSPPESGDNGLRAADAEQPLQFPARSPCGGLAHLLLAPASLPEERAATGANEVRGELERRHQRHRRSRREPVVLAF